MKPRIAVLTSVHFSEYIRGLMEFYHFNFEGQCTLDFYHYEKIAELPALYGRLADDYDGFCVTGNSSKKLLDEMEMDRKKPVQSISAHSAEYYKELFRLMDQDRAIDLKRVTTDFYLWLGSPIPANASEMITTDQLLADIQRRFLSEVPAEEILRAEETIKERTLEAWRRKEFDFAVCRFTSAYPVLKEAGIPCSFVYPSTDTVMDAVQLLLRQVRLNQMNEDLPAVIFLTAPAFWEDSITGINADSVNLQKCILDFAKENHAGFVIKQASNGYEIYTTQQIVKDITGNFTGCRLQKFIHTRLGMEVLIGYGIGQTVVQARLNALEACGASKGNQKSYLVTKGGELIGPLDQQSVLHVSPQASRHLQNMAKISGLSASTIQRIQSAAQILGTNELTTQELAGALQVTVANANRFLNALEKAGLAEILPEKKSYTKGRPSRVYRILFMKS